MKSVDEEKGEDQVLAQRVGNNSMNAKEKLLLSLSKEPGTGDSKREEEWTIENALNLLHRLFLDFDEMIKRKEILDFGCGEGYQAVAIALKGAKHVVGLDIREKMLQKGRELAARYKVEDRVDFCERMDEALIHKFDIVISQNSMEHCSNPSEALEQMKLALRGKGIVGIRFGPPWFAPYGGHINFFTKIPWVHVIFDEKTVMNVRTHFRSDGACRYDELEGGLNRMSVKRFEEVVSKSGLKIAYRKYDCVKKLNLLGKIPFLRECFINQLNCILEP